jgi:hypothetical protein
MNHRYTDPIGVRLPEEDREWINKAVEAFSIPQSTFIRLLLRYSLNKARENPSILFEGVGRC